MTTTTTPEPIVDSCQENKHYFKKQHGLWRCTECDTPRDRFGRPTVVLKPV